MTPVVMMMMMTMMTMMTTMMKTFDEIHLFDYLETENSGHVSQIPDEFYL